MIPHSSPCFSELDSQALVACLDSGFIAAGGSRTDKLTKDLCRWLNLEHAMLVGSGTIGIAVGLYGLGVRPGDEVLLSNYLCPSVADAILSIGAKPVPVDVEEGSIFPSVELVRAAMTDTAQVLILPYMFGVSCDISPFKQLGIKVLEDCCQIFYEEREFQLQGDCAVFSFHPTKMLASSGGGFVAFSNSTAYKSAEDFFASRCFAGFTDLAAALLLSQIQQVPEFLASRKRMAGAYSLGITGYDSSLMDKYREHSKFYRYVLQTKMCFDTLSMKAEEEGVIVRKGVDSLIHQHLGLSGDRFENSLNLLNSTVSIPIYPGLDDEQVDKVINVLNGLVG